MRRRLYIALISLVAAAGVVAQNAASSPYSLFGVGELNDNVPNAFRAMGGVGVGMRNNHVINMMQPASYTACDSLTFMFDIAASASWANYSDANGRRNRANGNIEYVTVQIPIWRQHIAVSLGTTPYSAAGYKLAVDGSEQGKECTYSYTKSYYGEGSISQIYGGASFNLFDWVAVGGNFYYLFGSTTAYTDLTFNTSGMTDVSQISYFHVSSFRYRLGAQVFHTFGEHNFTVGAIFESKMPLKSEGYYIETYSDFASDTASLNYEIPLTFGIGGSYCYDNRLTVAFDYLHQRWSEVKNDDALRDRNRFAIGLEYRDSPNARSYIRRMMWRVGANLGSSYVMPVSGLEYTVSAGVGFPLHGIGTHINFSLEYTHRQGAIPAYPKDNSLKFTINVAVAENWFFKRRL